MPDGYRISPHMTLPWLATALAVTFVTGAIYWSLSTLFFAAIAENVRESDLAQPRLLADAYTRVRERIGVLTPARTYHLDIVSDDTNDRRNSHHFPADLNNEAFWDRIGPAMGCGRCCPSLDSHCRPALQVRTSDTSANGE